MRRASLHHTLLRGLVAWHLVFKLRTECETDVDIAIVQTSTPTVGTEARRLTLYELQVISLSTCGV